MLLVGGDHLIAGAQVQSGEHRVAAVCRGAGQRHVGGVGAEQVRVAVTDALGKVQDDLDVRLAGAAMRGLVRDSFGDRLRGGGGQRPLGAGVQVGALGEDRELRTKCGGVGHGAHLMHGL